MCSSGVLVVIKSLKEGDIRHDPMEGLAELDELKLPLLPRTERR